MFPILTVTLSYFFICIITYNQTNINKDSEAGFDCYNCSVAVAVAAAVVVVVAGIEDAHTDTHVAAAVAEGTMVGVDG
jgi:hypothetical protein